MITTRQQQILQLIVQLYGEYEEPIGSKTLLQESYLQVSPATIRNEMLALERNGLLRKAHSSSGRIPSFEGYRYYLDHLLHNWNNAEIEQEDSEHLRRLFQDRTYNVQQHGQLAANILASLTQCTAVVVAGSSYNQEVADIQLLALSDYEVVAIILTNEGVVESEIITLPVRISSENLQATSKLLNDALVNQTLNDALQRLKFTLPLEIQRIVGYQIDFSPLCVKVMQHLDANRYYVSGKTYLFDALEQTQDIRDYKRVFELVDGSATMLKKLDEKPFGMEAEIKFAAIDQLTMITAHYQYQNQKCVLGLIGPATMSYPRVVGLMSYIMRTLAN